MITQTFSSEWISIGRHRVFIWCRCGAPGKHERDIAELVSQTVDSNAVGDGARLVELFFDDKASFWNLFIRSTDPDDRELNDVVQIVLGTTFDCGNFDVEVLIVPPGNTASDRYNQTAYLTHYCGVGIDRLNWEARQREGGNDG